jgi:Na+-driven multidrug efflux pump
LFFGVAVVLRSVLEGMGDLKYCSFMGISALGIRVVMSYVLRPAAGMRAIAFAEGISWTMLLLVFVIRILVKRHEFGNDKKMQI